jgi:4-amino-4-deoxy-L-arabinose transferase-like glycosyltransferase
VALAKAAASTAVLLGGFRAVSDDDFARVVIAEQWARAPRWDASGTSWLPFPFWIAGAAMKVTGRSLDTARVTAAALGMGAALLVYVAARWLGEARPAAGAGASLAAVFPWSARLGVATVPELLTAALTLLAVAALGTEEDRGRRRLLGGAALFAATLSRYEAWPVGGIFVAVCAVDAVRSRSPKMAAAAALALGGPVTWMAWNRAAHGDALHFLARVTAYRQALGGGEGTAAGRLLAYPVAMVREEPEIVAILAAAAAVVAIAGGRDVLRARLFAYARPAAILAVQIAALSLAMVKDGAPTHHPERAVLAALLLIALAGGALAASAAAAHRASLLAVVGAAVLAAGLGRGGAAKEGFVQRADEEAIGRAAAGLTRAGEPVLVEVADYGYLAVLAALGRPEDAVPDRSVDPRDVRAESSFAEPTSLRRRIAASGARWAVARSGETATAVLGAPVTLRGAWGLFRAEPSP